MYWLFRPEFFVVVLSKITFIGSKYPKSVVFERFEDVITVAGPLSKLHEAELEAIRNEAALLEHAAKPLKRKSEEYAALEQMLCEASSAVPVTIGSVNPNAPTAQAPHPHPPPRPSRMSTRMGTNWFTADKRKSESTHNVFQLDDKDPIIQRWRVPTYPFPVPAASADHVSAWEPWQSPTKTLLDGDSSFANASPVDLYASGQLTELAKSEVGSAKSRQSGNPSWKAGNVLCASL